MTKISYPRAVLTGGLIGGTLDILFAISFAAYRGMAPVRLLQTVASGLFGNAAFEGGLAMAAGGLLLHFVLALLWAGVLLTLARLRPAIVGNPYVCGCLFGIAVFLAMRLVVLPLSAFPFPVSFKPLGTVLDLMSHMFLFGIPIAVAVRKAVIDVRTPR
jgi:uncharacterized membrane protein YagU involved in acid resistance